MCHSSVFGLRHTAGYWPIVQHHHLGSARSYHHRRVSNLQSPKVGGARERGRSTVLGLEKELHSYFPCIHLRSNSNVAPSTSARHHGSRLNSARSQGRKEPKAPPPEGLTKKRKGSQTSQSLYEDSHYKDGRGLKLQGSGMGAINPIMVEDDEG